MIAKPSTGTLPAAVESALHAVHTKPNKWYYVAKYLYHSKIAPLFWSPKQWIKWAIENDTSPGWDYTLYLFAQSGILGVLIGYFYGLIVAAHVALTFTVGLWLMSMIINAVQIDIQKPPGSFIQNRGFSESELAMI